jgi:hypothetical protein
LAPRELCLGDAGRSHCGQKLTGHRLPATNNAIRQCRSRDGGTTKRGTTLSRLKSVISLRKLAFAKLDLANKATTLKAWFPCQLREGNRQSYLRNSEGRTNWNQPLESFLLKALPKLCYVHVILALSFTTISPDQPSCLELR